MTSYSYARTGLILLCVSSLPFESLAAADTEISEKTQICEQILSLEEFRAYALNNSPMVGEIDRDYASDLAKAFDLRVLANPELQAERTRTRMTLSAADEPQSQISISQPIRLSDFGKRDRVASLIKKSGDAQKSAKVLELTQKLIVQFRTLYVLQQTERIISEAELRATKKVSLIREGVKKGLISDGDEKLFEGEKYRLQAQKKGISSTISIMQSDLGRSIGSSCLIVTTDPGAFGETPSENLLLQKARASKLSESTRLALLASLAKEQTRLAELDAFPGITPRLVYQHTNDGGDYFGAGISIPLPFWNRNQGNRMRAETEHKVAETNRAFLANGGLESQIKSLRSAVISSKEQAELFSAKVVPSFEAALRAQEKLYSEGKGNVLQVWQTLRTFNEVQSQGLLLWLEAASARVQLSLLIGEEI